MNLFQGITLERLLLKPFYIQAWNSQDEYAGEGFIIPVSKWFGSEPVYRQYEPFRFGYEIQFSITTPANLVEYMEQNVMFLVISLENNIQVGGDEGFIISSVTPPATPDMCLYNYVFKSVKPNKTPFKIYNDGK